MSLKKNVKILEVYGFRDFEFKSSSLLSGIIKNSYIVLKFNHHLFYEKERLNLLNVEI